MGGVGREGGWGVLVEHNVSKPKPWREMVLPLEKKHSDVFRLGSESTQPVTGRKHGVMPTHTHKHTHFPSFPCIKHENRLACSYLRLV